MQQSHPNLLALPADSKDGTIASPTVSAEPTVAATAVTPVKATNPKPPSPIAWEEVPTLKAIPDPQDLAQASKIPHLPPTESEGSLALPVVA